MEHIDLALFFRQGPRKVDIMFNNGIATFKTHHDIIKFKHILDQWLTANTKMNEKKYTDYLQRLFPSYKHQPFIYQTQHETCFKDAVPMAYYEQEVIPTNYYEQEANAFNYFTMQDRERNLSKPKLKKKTKRSKSTAKNIKIKPKENDYITGNVNLRYDSEENNHEFEVQGGLYSSQRNEKEVENYNINSEVNKSKYSSNKIEQVFPIVMQSQFDSATGKNLGHSDNEASNNKKKSKSQLGSEFKQLPEGQQEFFDEEGRQHFRGQVQNDLANGQGILFFPNGVIEYKGELMENLLHGKGSLFNEFGELLYKGDFVEGKILMHLYIFFLLFFIIDF